MPRKRMIDPEHWSDEVKNGKWSFKARLFYLGLRNQADDEGRLLASSKLLRSKIFPYDDAIEIEKLKDEVRNIVIWYEVDGKEYGFITDFFDEQQIQRPKASKIPPPPGEVPSVKIDKLIKNRKPHITFDPEKRTWDNISVEDLEAWQKAYPATEPAIELNKMGEWLIANPKKIKSNYRRFIINWLNRSQDKGGTKGGSKEELENILEKYQ